MAAGDFTAFGIARRFPINSPLSAFDYRSNPITTLRDMASPEFKAHESWYDSNLPTMLDKYNKEIGSNRSQGTLRDIAAEFAGAADFAQRYKGDAEQAKLNANLYQLYVHGLTKNARDNMGQDKAGIDFGMQNKEMSKEDLVKAAVEYAKRTAPYAPINNMPYNLEDY